MSIKLQYKYSQVSATLVVEGLPDLSLNQKPETIGIVSSWKLSLIGSSQLEGKLPHLRAMMISVLPYARYCLSDVKKHFGDINSPVSISPFKGRHKLVLRSSKENVKSLEILLDDAELSDLVRCLDSLRKDQKVQIDWELDGEKPLGRKEKKSKTSVLVSFGIPIIGASLALLTSFSLLMIPTPDKEPLNENLSSINLLN